MLLLLCQLRLVDQQTWHRIYLMANTGITFENCAPCDYYGPYVQTLFLGCSILEFSATVGWNEQVGEVIVQLAEDTCTSTNDKEYWDASLTKQTTNDADPGFLGTKGWIDSGDNLYFADEAATVGDDQVELIGMPVYFRVDNFEFSGIIQSWEEHNGDSAHPSYTVKLSDPRQIIEGTQLIIGDYSGAVFDTYNLINVYGFLEGLYGASCPLASLTSLPPYPASWTTGAGGPDGATFGASSGGFGGANISGNGIQWTLMLPALNTLINAAPNYVSPYSPYGRLVFKGSKVGGYGLLKADRLELFDFDGYTGVLSDYFIDFSDLPVPPSYWRLSGMNISLMDAISQLCDASGCDYYVDMIPVVDAYGGASGVAKIIKIRTVSRVVQPDLGQIDTFIGNSEGLISSTKGRELRNEPTQSFVVGGNRRGIYQIEQFLDDDVDSSDDIILPYFGKYANGNSIIPSKNDDYPNDWEFIAETDSINEQLEIVGLPAYVTITEPELRASLIDYEAWLMMMGPRVGDEEISPPQIGATLDALGIAGLWSIGQLLDQIRNNVSVDAMNPNILNQTSGLATIVTNDATQARQLKDVQTIYSWVKSFAETYYGQQFQVRVPFTCMRRDGDTGQVLMSESPIEGGWTEQDSIIGAVNQGIITNFFTSEGDNLLGSFVRVDPKVVTYKDVVTEEEEPRLAPTDLSEINPSEYVTLDDDIFIRCSIEEEYVYSNVSTLFGPRVVISLGSRLAYKDPNDNTAPGIGLIHALIGINGSSSSSEKDAMKHSVNEVMARTGNKSVYSEIAPRMRIPDAAAFGIQSNTLIYGPWGAQGPAGQVVIERNEGLVPWEYGSFYMLDRAGRSKATQSLTLMQIGEMGSIESPGYPEIPMGAELGAYDGGFYGAGTHLVENRTLSIKNDGSGDYGGFDYNGKWTGLYGPSVTNISISFGSGGLTTSYAMRTFTPQYGRFQKYNANRLKQIGKLRLQQQKQARDLATERLRERAKASKKAKVISRAFGDKGKSGTRATASTPHQNLVFQTIEATGTPTGVIYDFTTTLGETIQTKELGNEFEDFDKKTFMSLDGLYRPVGMLAGVENGPGYSMTAANTAASSNSLPPITFSGIDGTGEESAYSDFIVNSEYLNAFGVPALSGQWYGTSGLLNVVDSYTSHDVGMVSVPKSGTTDTPPDDGMFHNYDFPYRVVATKGPIIMGGWGYDVDGFPVPNATGEGGIRQNKFQDNWLKRQEDWKVGPIDLRWDDSRKVWVSPQPYKTLNFEAIESGTPGSFGDSGSGITIAIDESSYDNPSGYDKIIKGAWDATENGVYSGMKGIVEYDKDEGYRLITDRLPVVAHGPLGQSGIYFTDFGVDTSFVNVGSLSPVGSNSEVEIGFGTSVDNSFTDFPSNGPSGISVFLYNYDSLEYVRIGTRIPKRVVEDIRLDGFTLEVQYSTIYVWDFDPTGTWQTVSGWEGTDQC